jgi:hypothetical protein
MEPHGVFKEVPKQCTDKDHDQFFFSTSPLLSLRSKVGYPKVVVFFETLAQLRARAHLPWVICSQFPTLNTHVIDELECIIARSC